MQSFTEKFEGKSLFDVGYGSDYMKIFISAKKNHNLG